VIRNQWSAQAAKLLFSKIDIKNISLNAKKFQFFVINAILKLREKTNQLILKKNVFLNIMKK